MTIEERAVIFSSKMKELNDRIRKFSSQEEIIQSRFEISEDLYKVKIKLNYLNSKIRKIQIEFKKINKFIIPSLVDSSLIEFKPESGEIINEIIFIDTKIEFLKSTLKNIDSKAFSLNSIKMEQVDEW